MTTLPKTPSFRLDGRRAFVSGAGRGIGLGAASALASAGAHVTLAARTRDDVETAAAALRAQGLSADVLAIDVTDIDGFRAAIAARRAEASPFRAAPSERRTAASRPDGSVGSSSRIRV